MSVNSLETKWMRAVTNALKYNKAHVEEVEELMNKIERRREYQNHSGLPSPYDAGSRRGKTTRGRR